MFLDKNFNLEFSKETNNLPIAYSKLDFGHPCLNQSEIQGEVSPPDYQDLLMLNFPSETQKYGCSFDFANQVDTDARYLQASTVWSISEFTLQE